MEVLKLTCASCGAPIQVPTHLDAFNCAYCGTPLTVERGEGYVALQMAEKMARAVEESGTRTQSVIREELEATRSQLRTLELNQQLGAVQARLYSVQSDIRALDRQKKGARERRELRDLQAVESRLIARTRELQKALHPPSEHVETEPVPKPGASGCSLILLLVVLLFACSFMWTTLAAIGVPPLPALVVTAILLAFIASKLRSRGRA